MDGGIHEDPYTEVANVLPNPDAVQEFSYQTNNYGAKFAGRGGGVVNIVTRSGSNEFHASFFEYLRNGELNARNFFAPRNDGLKRNQYGLAGGGPILRNKTFFFGSWQGTQVRSLPSSLTATVATAASAAATSRISYPASSSTRRPAYRSRRSTTEHSWARPARWKRSTPISVKWAA